MLHFKWIWSFDYHFPLATGLSSSDSDGPHDDLTSSSRSRKVTLLPKLAVSLSSRVVSTKPRGGRFGHCCFLAVYISFTPFVQLFATTLRYLKHTQKPQKLARNVSFFWNQRFDGLILSLKCYFRVWMRIGHCIYPIGYNTIYASLIDSFWAAQVFVAGWIGFGHNLCASSDTISGNDNRVLSRSLPLSVILHSCSEWTCFLTDVGFKLGFKWSLSITQCYLSG